ncbi:tyrosine recombinase XerC [Rhizobacter sp. Root404]|uniref:site-specific integrase n=1 Tax=Rhizobacter sp. Root404 TaxID=1736528 RepID=UPI0009E8F21C|nr:site-specific integrase [Rhizobacter sp. Root404]
MRRTSGMGHTQRLPELGGPTVATVAMLLNRYAHEFTVIKGGCEAELGRINHYLVGARLPALRRELIDGSHQLLPKEHPIGSKTPAGWQAHLAKRRSRRTRTYDLIRAIGATRCADLSTRQLRELSTTMKAEGLTPSTVQKELAVLKAAFNVAIREWHWDGFRNPAVGIALGQSQHRFVRLTPEQESRLVDALTECDNPQFWPMVELALVSTMRRGSLLKLEWDKLSLETREVHVWAKGSNVTLPLSQRAVQLLRAVPRNDTPFVFSMSKNAVKLAWEGVRAKAGLKWLRFADLRHLGATFYARAGLNAHELRLVLGHKTTKMAEVYVNLVNTDVIEALDRAETKMPVTRSLPTGGVRVRRETCTIIAERRTARLNGEPRLPANVVRLFPRE